MYIHPFTPQNSIYMYCVANPFDYSARAMLGDWLQEHGYQEEGEYLVASVLDCCDNRICANKELWWRSWYSNMPQEFIAFLEFHKGMPSWIDLRHNQRNAILIRPEHNWDFEDSPGISYGQSRLVINLPNMTTIFRTYVECFPIEFIDLGWAYVVPFHGIIVVNHGSDEWDIHHYKEAGYTLIDWWRALNGRMRQRFQELEYRSYVNILRGYGDVRLAQHARSTTIRGGRRPGANRRSLVHTIQGDFRLTTDYDGVHVHRVQQRVRSVPDQQALQHVAILRERREATTFFDQSVGGDRAVSP